MDSPRRPDVGQLGPRYQITFIKYIGAACWNCKTKYYAHIFEMWTLFCYHLLSQVHM